MKMLKLWQELVRRNRLLAYSGLLFLGLAVVSVVLIPFDHRTVMGLNPWIKPLKFDLSVMIYLWSIGWLLYPMQPTYPRTINRISWGVLICMLVEITCIKIQAVRGVYSHFNASTPFDSILFGIMGQFILINTLLITFATILYWWHKPPVATAYVWGIRLGLLVFLLGSLVGVIMVVHNAHSIGVADGGPGLPLLNWSTIAGDLRAAHFVGMHALQLFPLAGYLLYRYQVHVGKLSPVALTVIFCVSYSLLATFVFSLAMAGKPLMNMVGH